MAKHENVFLNKKTVAFHTLGCKVNAYETDAMSSILKNEGMIQVAFTEKADVYVVNTCSVTNIADRKSRQMLHRVRKLNPEALVVATGCYVQVKCDEERRKNPERAGTYSEELLQEVGCDLIIGNNEKNEIARILSDWFSGKHEVAVREIAKEKDFMDLSIDSSIEHTRAYVKVQDGCNQFCTYCIIPYARGRIRSKDTEAVVKEIEALTEKGVQEVVLTGIHLSSYGLTGSERYDDLIDEIRVQGRLLCLIQRVSEIPGVKRIRLGSLEPRIITEEFAEALSKIPAICPHFHLSLQSGCLETLKRMNRHYTPEEYEKSCEILRKYFDDPAITTDVIVGFPQETEEEFEKSLQFVSKIGFYEMHIFKYSRRKGTVADGMKGQVSDEKKEERSRRMIELSEKMSEEFRKRHEGKLVEVLAEDEENIDGKNYRAGYTKEYIRTILPEGTKENEIVSGKLAFSPEIHWNLS